MVAEAAPIEACPAALRMTRICPCGFLLASGAECDRACLEVLYFLTTIFMSQTDNRCVAEKLSFLTSRNPFTLEADVARTLLDQRPDDIASLMRDLAQGGCLSGLIGTMVYYADTHEFFDRHYEAIELLRQDTEANMGEPLRICGDLKNTLA